jgi:hypothetical protein
MSVNRYHNRQVYSQFNPLSIDELSILPIARQKEHDASMQFAMQQKAMADAIPLDAPDRDRLVAEIDARIGDYTKNLMMKGVGQGSTNALLELKKYKDDLVGPNGDLGKISANAAAYKAHYEDQKKRFEKGDITKEQFERSIASSLKQYGGYKEGNYNGYIPSKYVDINKKVVDFSEKIKHDVYTREGYKSLGIDPTTGKSVWQKNGRTTSDVPPGTDQLIMNYVQSDEEIQAQLRDDIHFTKTLGLYNTDEMGNIVAGNKSYNPENPEGAAEAMATERMLEAAKLGYGVASSGKKDLRSTNLDFIGIDSGVNGDPDKPGYPYVTGDVGNTPQYYNNSEGLKGVKETIEKLKASNDPQDKVRAEKYQQWVDKQKINFDNSAEGKKLKAAKDAWAQKTLKEIEAKTGIKGLPISLVENMAVGGTNTLKEIFSEEPTKVYQKDGKYYTKDEYVSKFKEEPNHRTRKYKYSFGIIDGIQKEKLESALGSESLSKLVTNSPAEQYYDRMDKIISEGQLAEARVFSVSSAKLNDLQTNDQMLKRVISPTAYQVVGLESEEESIALINGITNSKIEKLDYISYGDYDTPSIKVTFTPKGASTSQTVVLKSKPGNRVSGLPNTFEAGINDLFSDAKNGREVINTLLTEQNYFGKDNFNNEFSNLGTAQILESNNGYRIDVGRGAMSVEDYYRSFDQYKDLYRDELEEIVAKETGNKDLYRPMTFDKKSDAIQFLSLLNQYN